MYRLLPDLSAVLAPEYRNIRPVSADLFGGKVIEGKYIFNYPVLILIDSTFFSACVRHHEYLFFSDRIVSGVGIDAQKSEDTAGCKVHQA